ncbi:uncharacterized protein [Littorina saxatilis]|uniref:uncharacterized protein n=1 Tax=Littorina saxatilis TaxID=31220 RepID=UPI0038B433F8
MYRRLYGKTLFTTATMGSSTSKTKRITVVSADKAKTAPTNASTNGKPVTQTNNTTKHGIQHTSTSGKDGGIGVTREQQIGGKQNRANVKSVHHTSTSGKDGGIGEKKEHQNGGKENKDGAESSRYPPTLGKDGGLGGKKEEQAGRKGTGKGGDAVENGGTLAKTVVQKTGVTKVVARRASHMSKRSIEQKAERPNTGRGRFRGQRHEEKGDANTDVIFSLLAGDVTLECPASDKIVRIFLSSTFTDTSNERNSLMERVYPRLKEWCQEKGYQFQVVDMRWGVRDVATDDHRTTDLCLREIDLCNKLSTGPCFVTLLSHKYGYRSFPREFTVDEFEKILTAVTSQRVKDLLKKWFKKDNNAVPATYILQPISSQLPDYLSNQEEPRSKAANQWWEENELMQTAIGQAAVTYLGKERAHAILQSVTETEIRRGWLDDPAELFPRGLWFYRCIEDIENVQPSRVSGRFKDARGSEAKQAESRKMLKALKTELLSKLPQDRVVKYSIAWDEEKGIDPENDPRHKDYINNFCNDFEQHLRSMTQEAITARDQDHRVNPLVEEVTQHTRFCQEKCRSFYGRQDALNRVSAYLQNEDSRQVFVIHGKSGSGKTSIVAMAASEASRLQQGKGVVILRFLGTTPDSTTVGGLLTSILKQLSASKQRSLATEELPANVKDLSDLLEETLVETASDQFPVTLLLDSLDQLDPANGARELSWLPTDLPPHVRVIVSTLPEAQYDAFPKLQAMYQDDKSNFYQVPILGDNDVSGILDQWLAASKRQLTANQRQLVMDAFKSCPLPLFLKLSFDTACKWRSYFLPSHTVLQTTVRDSINMMFAELEKSHGETLVSRALAYLTISQSGLTETELEDILSCDDDVLNDVYTFWTPPVRRLPPLLLVRLKADLGQYLVDRGADGVGVFFWYHRQFIEAAHDRYCRNDTAMTALHAALAHFFSGVWSAGKPKPYVDKSGNSAKADRIVSPQPLKFGNSFNLRKLNNLPYHAIQAQNKDQLKEECLLNFRFVQSKLIACGVRAVLDDYSAARKAFPNDEDLKIVAEALQLSQDALQYDPLQLPAQIICRLQSVPKGVQGFLQQCRESDGIFLIPSKQLLIPPGGQLVHCLNEHTSDVTGLAMTDDGKFVVTCSYDRSLSVVDVAEGRRVRKIEGVGNDLENVFLCCNDTVIVTDSDDFLVAYAFESGVPLWKKTDLSHPLICACGEGRSTLLIYEESFTFYDAKTGAKGGEVEVPRSMRKFDFSSSVPIAGNTKHVATTDLDQRRIVVCDVKTKQLVATKLMTYEVNFSTRTGDDDDDFCVEGLAISGDGKYVICANADDNNIYFLDVTTLETVTVLKGFRRDYSEKFRVTADGKYLYFPNRRAVRVVDLDTHRTASCLMHINTVIGVATQDMRTVVTVADDRLIRIWDLSRGLPEGKTSSLEFKDVPVWERGMPSPTDSNTSDQKSKEDVGKEIEEEDEQADDKNKMTIRDMVMLSSPRYVLLVCYVQSNKQYFLQVYDTATETCVRKASLGETLPKCIQHLEGTRIVATVEGRLKVIDVDKMAVITSCQGRMGRSPVNCTWLVDGRKGVITLTCGSKHLKVYSMETGRVVAMLKQTEPNPKQIETVVVNEHSPLVVAETEDYDKLLVFNLKEQRHLFTILPEDMKQDSLILSDAAITPDGRLLLLTGSIDLEGSSGEKETESVIFVYDLEKRQLLHYLMDEVMFWQYKADKDCKLDTYCNTFKLLDDVRLISAHDDFLVRVFNFHTGEILCKLEGHLSAPDIYSQPSCPVLVTHGTYSEENAFRMWSKADFTPLASFSMDDELKDFMLLGEHSHKLLTTSTKFEEPVVFHVHGANRTALLGNEKPLTSHQEIFQGKKLSQTVAHLTKDEGVADASDPDDDVVDETEDEDDDDDIDLNVKGKDKEDDDEDDDDEDMDDLLDEDW